MKTTMWLGFLLVAWGASAGPLSYFEARISTPGQQQTLEVVQARDAAAATDILEGRSAQIKVHSMRRLDRQDGHEWFLARLSVDGANIVDTALAKGSGEARRTFEARYAKGRIVSLSTLAKTDGYACYETSIHGASRKVFKDIVFAESISQAQETLRARYPGARLGSVSIVR